jgi:hypothetical protein
VNALLVAQYNDCALCACGYRLKYFHHGGTIASIERLASACLEDIMKNIAFIILALAMGAGVAFAQTPVVPTVQPSAMTKVENWTSNQWNAAMTEWAKDKIKWAGCQQQSTDQKLTGPESWSFLYTCMNT